eukprot:2996168-Amphidinium_carterae.1
MRAKLNVNDATMASFCTAMHRGQLLSDPGPRYAPQASSNHRRLAGRHAHDVKNWKARCTGRGEVPVGRGALDETLDLALETELTTAAGDPQAGIFLDCGKCYERIPLHSLENFALESG